MLRPIRSLQCTYRPARIRIFLGLDRNGVLDSALIQHVRRVVRGTGVQSGCAKRGELVADDVDSIFDDGDSATDPLDLPEAFATYRIES